MSTAASCALEAISSEADLRAEVERLRRRNAQLELSTQELERFAFMASHDLREPLRMITTYAQLLARKCAGQIDTEAAICVTNIVDGSTRMSELLSDLLAYTNLVARPPESTETVDLNVVLDNVKQNLKPSIDETKAEITSDHLPTLNVHASDFVSLFQNLLANAMKYRNTHSAPRIHVAVREGDGQLIFAVSDNGIGIAPQFHQTVFEPFKRLHERSVPGTGLGLAICQQIVKRHEGRIWLDSEVGSGAIFSFAIPATIMKRRAAR